jgi:hypothetical protein
VSWDVGNYEPGPGGEPLDLALLTEGLRRLAEQQTTDDSEEDK